MFRYTIFLNVNFFRCLMWVVWYVKLFKHARSRQFDCESWWSNNLNHRHQWITNIGNWIDNLATKLRESHYVFFCKNFYQVFKDGTFYKRNFFREFQSMISASDDCHLSSNQDTQLIFDVGEDQAPYLLFDDKKILQ